MKTVLIPIVSEQDRQTVAGILVKNFIAVRPVKIPRKKRDGTPGNSTAYALQVELEEAQGVPVADD